jgi:hypothetical protein
VALLKAINESDLHFPADFIIYVGYLSLQN